MSSLGHERLLVWCLGNLAVPFQLPTTQLTMSNKVLIKPITTFVKTALKKTDECYNLSPIGASCKGLEANCNIRNCKPFLYFIKIYLTWKTCRHAQTGLNF